MKNKSTSVAAGVPPAVSVTRWKITIKRDALLGSSWTFAYNGKLTAWQIICITLAGWKIERIKK